MSEIRFKKVKIIDLFKPVNGSGDYTKTFCSENKGIYPVYSGNTVKEFSMINQYDYDGEYLTWAKDGLAGYIMILNGKFALTNHRGILIPKVNMNNLDIKYLKYMIEPVFRKNIKGRRGVNGENEYTTLNGKMIERFKDEIKIPIDLNGNFDLVKQKEISEKLDKIEFDKKILIEKKNKLSTYEIVNNDTNFNYEYVPLTQIYTPIRGKSSYTKSYCQKHHGIYPLYSANNTEPFMYVDFYDYDCSINSVSVAGIAGIFTKLEGKFSITSSRVILEINPKYKNIVNENYIKYICQPIFRKKIKGRRGHNGENEFTNLPLVTIRKIKIPIPINENKEWDLNAQNIIASKYDKIFSIKRNIVDTIDELVNIKAIY